MTFSDALNEIEATNKAHFATITELIARLRNDDISVGGYRTQVARVDEEYHAKMTPLIRIARERSWVGRRHSSQG